MLDFTDFSGYLVYNTCKIIEMNRLFSVQIALKIYKQVAQYMYKYLDKLQHSFHDFNQPLGMHMNPENRWVRLAEQIPWDVFESKYAKRNSVSQTANLWNRLQRIHICNTS